MLKSTVNPLRRWFGFFLPERRRAFAAAKKLNQIGINIIESYRKLEDPLKGTMIQQIMICDAYKNDAERAAEVFMLLTAGYDTTANSLAWILLELARNPAELSRLRESLSGIPSVEWSRSEVLKMVIKEGIRLHPVSAGGSARVIGRDMITSAEKMLMPKGSTIIVPLILLFRNPDIYGENVDVFCPSRWENPTKEMLDEYLPFALGKQNCIGQSLANAEMHCIAARICSEFDLEVEEEGGVDFFLILKPVGARLKARKLNTS
jgi:cytochrome P450